MSQKSESATLSLSAMVVSLGTLSSRILGLVRDMSLAAVFGASRVSDVFFIAFQLPSTFRKLLAEGALSSSVVPVVTDAYQNRSEQHTSRLASATFTWGILGVGGLTGLGIVFAPYMVMVVAPGFIGTDSFPLAVALTRVMFPFLLLMSAASIAMGVLHARKRFAPSAFAPALFNLFFIASILGLAPRLGAEPRQRVWGLVVGVLVGGFAQFFVQWWALRREGIRLRWNPEWDLPGLKRILTMMGPMTFGLAFSQLIVLVDKLVASFLDAGNISHLYYSNRLFQFPFALVGIAFGTVVLPAASEQVASGSDEEVVSTARRSLGMMSFLMVPSTVGLWLVGHPLIGLLFGGRRFTILDQDLTYGVLFFALLGLLAYGCIRIFVSLCYSFEDTVGPVQAAAVAFVINAVLDVGFVWLWPSNRFRVCGLTLAGSIAVWAQVWVLRKRLNRHLPHLSIIPWSDVAKHGLFSLVMAGVVYPITHWFTRPLWKVGVGCLVGTVVYVTVGYLSGDPYPVQTAKNLRDSLKSRLSASEEKP